MFTEKFTGTVVCVGESITCEVDGFECEATLHHDDHEPPWKSDDGHGPVSEFNTYLQDDEIAPTHRILKRTRGRTILYNATEALKLAMKDGWGTSDGQREGESAVAYRMRAVENDFEFLKGWVDDEWTYIGVMVTASKEGIILGRASLWGIESCCVDYVNETANELIDEALDEARKVIAKLAA